MPIIYPLTIPGPPTTPGPSETNPKKYDAVGEFIGPFDGGSQQQQNQDQHWELDLVWPEMTWEQFAPLDAFAGALHGKWGSFLWGPPLATAPRGSALGTPVTAPSLWPSGVTPSGSNLLYSAGWLPSQSGLLLPGDYLQLGPTYQSSGFNIVAVQVIAGVLYVTVAGTLTIPQEALLDSAPIGFQGLTIATWLNGWLFQSAGFAPVGGNTQFFFNPSPSGGAGGTIPTNYGPAAESVGWVLPPPGTPVTVNPARLYQYVNPNPLVSDGGGNAVLDIFPAIHEPPPGGVLTPLVLLNPQGTFRLAENRRESPAKKNKTVIFQMKCREAI